MKKLFIILAAVIITASVFAQTPPQMMSYQAVIRNANGSLVQNGTVGMEISILQGSSNGVVVYEETQSPTTNTDGLVSIEIGSGTVTGTGTFSGINWANGPYFIETGIDPTGGTNYSSITSTSQLLSVPYALYAANSGGAIKVTAFTPAGGCGFSPSLTTTYQKIGDMGTFTKSSGTTNIELDLQTTLYVLDWGTSNWIIYELRVDSAATTLGNATEMLYNPSYIGSESMVTPASITGIFTGLGSGSHTVSFWAMCSATASATWDPGCYDGYGVNNVYVKEY